MVASRKPLKDRKGTMNVFNRSYHYQSVLQECFESNALRTSSGGFDAFHKKKEIIYFFTVINNRIKSKEKWREIVSFKTRKYRKNHVQAPPNEKWGALLESRG